MLSIRLQSYDKWKRLGPTGKAKWTGGLAFIDAMGNGNLLPIIVGMAINTT